MTLMFIDNKEKKTLEEIFKSLSSNSSVDKALVSRV